MVCTSLRWKNGIIDALYQLRGKTSRRAIDRQCSKHLPVELCRKHRLNTIGPCGKADSEGECTGVQAV